MQTNFAVVILLCLSLFGCGRPASTRPVAAHPFQGVEGGPKLLAIYQPWWGDAKHIDVGYSSHNPQTLQQQIARAREMNISGFVVNWYGPRREYNDKTLGLLMQAAQEHGDFKIAAQYDEAVDNPGNATDAVIVDLQYLYDKYISANAGPMRSAYLTYQGRPVIFIFPKASGTEWDRVRQVTNSWPERPLLIYKDQNEKYDSAFDGYYAWVHPGKRGWQRDGSAKGLDYLDWFYKTMSRRPDKITVGGVWPGFDDSKASWSQNRHMSYGCGQTFADTMAVFRKYYGSENAPPFLLVETWNDYEEGTDVERGVSHCGPGGRQTVDTTRAAAGGRD